MEAVKVAEELQQAIGGNRRAMARVLSQIENGEVLLSDLLKSSHSIESEAWSTMAITGAPCV